MQSNGPIIIVLGPQGAGKGTQVALLTEQFGIPAVAAGDLFRTAAAQDTEIGRRAKAVLDAGGLMSIDLWEPVVGAYLDTLDLSRGYFLDGLLRSVEQIESFNRILAKRQLAAPFVLSIVLDDATATERLLARGRADDTPEQIRARLAWSRTQMQPVIEYFRSAGRLIEVDGKHSIDEVHNLAVAGLIAAKALPEVQ